VYSFTTVSQKTLYLKDITIKKKVQKKQKGEREETVSDRDRLREALDRLPVPSWMRNSRTDLVWCNSAYASFIDSTSASVIADQLEWPFKAAQKTAENLLPGKAQAQAALDEENPKNIRVHVILLGKRHLMEVSEIPLPAFNMTLGFACDLTREEDLKTVHSRDTAANKELLEQLGTAIGIYDVSQQLEFYNSAFSRLWDLEDSYLNAHPKLGDIMEKLREMRRLPEQADFRSFKKSWLSMFTGLLAPHEDMLYLPDGSALRMLAVPHPMGGLMMTFEDVTSRLELESSYNTLVAVQKETIDNLAEGVSVYGGDGRLKLWNPAFAQLWFLHPEDLEGEPHITRLVEKMKGRFTAKTWKKQSQILINQALDRNLRDGRMDCAKGALIDYATIPLPDGGVLVTHIDVTDTVRVENALREKNAALEAAERLKTDFLANVSYQLRTPLSTIMGFTEILDNEYFGPLNEKQKEYTVGMHEAGERLLSLIDDILDLSTIEAGYLSLEKDDVAIYDLLRGLCDLTGAWARKEKIEVILDCRKNIGKVFLDERRVKQVLLNLVRNAIAYTPAGGKITLAAKKEEKALVLSVSDTGQGISKEDQERIFKPFERVLTTSEEGRKGRTGAGLGLTLVKNIVEMHDGTIMVESVENKGATFTMTFPLQGE